MKKISSLLLAITGYAFHPAVRGAAGNAANVGWAEQREAQQHNRTLGCACGLAQPTISLTHINSAKYHPTVNCAAQPNTS